MSLGIYKKNEFISFTVLKAENPRVGSTLIQKLFFVHHWIGFGNRNQHCLWAVPIVSWSSNLRTLPIILGKAQHSLCSCHTGSEWSSPMQWEEVQISLSSSAGSTLQTVVNSCSALWGSAPVSQASLAVTYLCGWVSAAGLLSSGLNWTLFSASHRVAWALGAAQPTQVSLSGGTQGELWFSLL